MFGNKYVAAAVGIILVLVIAYNVKFFASKKNQPEPSVAQISAPLEPSKHEPVNLPERILEKGDKERWERDPFDLKTVVENKTEEKEPEKHDMDIRLMGIIKRNGRSLALIDGKVYRVHDEFDNAIIKEIKRHSIILLCDGETKEISFEDYIVLKEKTK